MNSKNDRERLTRGMDARSFIALLLAGVLTGSELTSWGIVHPTLWKLDHAEQVRAEKLMYRASPASTRS